MGVGTNLLGYAVDRVDSSVVRALKNSNMSSLNCQRKYCWQKNYYRFINGLDR